MDVALDANILIADPWLRSQNMRVLLDFVRKTHSQILLHEIAEAEAHAHFKRHCLDAIKGVEGALREVRRYEIAGIPDFSGEESLASTLARYDENFKRVLHKNICRRLPLDNAVLSEVTRRAVERVPPCSHKGEGFRDTIIWLNLLDRCKRTNDEIAFISLNTADFAASDRVTLRPELQTDLESYGVYISYYPSLASFLKKLAEPVAHITKDWISARLDMEQVKTLVRQSLTSVFRSNYKIDSSEYKDYYEPYGNPYILDLEISFDDVYVWKFADQHIEVELSFYVNVEALIDCERIRIPARSYYHEDEYPSSKELECTAELGCDISAVAAGESLSLLEVEDTYSL